MKALLAGSELCRNLGDEARSGGVVCRRFEDFDAVFESDTCDNLGQVICAFQPPPITAAAAPGWISWTDLGSGTRTARALSTSITRAGIW
jgi:hypothetical protein